MATASLQAQNKQKCVKTVNKKGAADGSSVALSFWLLIAWLLTLLVCPEAYPTVNLLNAVIVPLVPG